MLWSAQLHLHAESPHGWDPQLEAHPKGDSDPGGPNDTQRIITNQKQQIKYPCYRIRDTQSLKDKQMHDNVQLPSSRGTMTRTLTLQVTRNRQHDTSRPSVQPNHQDYVSMTNQALLCQLYPFRNQIIFSILLMILHVSLPQ